MAVTASMVKELRERTGAGMMECKKALTETDGDQEAAVEMLRKKGAASADKKSSRIAAEGAIIQKVSDDGRLAVMVEVNCETDFVAKGDPFNDFGAAVAERILISKPASVDELMSMPLEDGGASVEDVRKELVGGKIGENISVRRFVVIEAAANEVIGSYLHGVKIGVLVQNKGGDESLARDIAMHVAASRPVSIDESGVPADLLAKEREIYLDQARASGKPEAIMEKMVDGRVRKYLAEVTLTGQPFVKDPDQTVGKLLGSAGASTLAFERFEVGEGIEKRADDFVAEVMAQAQGS
ncbi:MAG: elongation factor Ts [marine bacterium B5-7]|nr:MAG: elongation factor Ts [marine bacterium B5-7]